MVTAIVLTHIGQITRAPCLRVHGAVLALKVGGLVYVEDVSVEELANQNQYAFPTVANQNDTHLACLCRTAVGRWVCEIVCTLHTTRIRTQLGVERTRGEQGGAYISVVPIFVVCRVNDSIAAVAGVRVASRIRDRVVLVSVASSNDNLKIVPVLSIVIGIG